jgi:N-acyl-phosphatidylethanolamine-hydrolysing phospholipase D
VKEKIHADEAVGLGQTVIKMARVDMTPDPKLVTETMHIRTPTFGAPSSSSPSSSASTPATVDPDTSIKATWLGHACFLVEFPSHGTPAGKDDLAKGVKTRGVRILFDPVFSDRCSPVGFMGPKRYTQPPCKLEDLPEVDAIVISVSVLFVSGSTFF